MASERAQNMLTRLAAEGATEQVTYYAANRGPGKTLEAVVLRRVPDGLLHGSAPQIEVEVLNAATGGILAATLDLGTDRIEVAERVGKPPRRRQITAILEQDDDWLKLVVR